jgi:PAS domain S-box-containing protein
MGVDDARAMAPAVDVAELVTAALSTVTRHSAVVLDRDLRYRAVAGTGHEAAPYDAAALEGRLASEVLGPDLWRLFGAPMRDALAVTSTTLELQSRVGAGRAEATCSPVTAGGRVLGVLVVTRELEPAADPGTSRGDAEVADVFGLTFDHSPICQALLSPDGRWARANRALCDLLGVREADLVGRHFRDVTDPRDHGVETAWLDLLRSGELDDYALPSRFLRPDGESVRAHVRLVAARDRAGDLQGFVAQLIDLHG